MGEIITDGAASMTSITMGYVSVVGTGGNLAAAISDNLDSTYVDCDNTQTGEIVLHLPTPSIPANATVTGLYFELRRSTNSVNQANPYFIWKVAAWDKGFFGANQQLHGIQYPASFTGQLPAVTTIYDLNSGAVEYMSDGTHVKDLDPSQFYLSLGLYASGGAGVSLKLYRLRTHWFYKYRPTVTVTAPVTTANSSKPTVTWTYSDVENDPQRSWRLVVVEDGYPSSLFPYGYPGDTGFVPLGGKVVYDSGVRYDAVNSWQVTSGLENGKTYWAYVQGVTDPIGGEDQASVWAGSKFTVAVTPPTPPVLTVYPDSANGRVQVQLREGSVNPPYTMHYDVQRSEDDGASWYYVRGGDFGGLSAGWYSDGSSGNGWYTPDRPIYDFASGMSVRWWGALNDYTPSTLQVFAGQWQASGNQLGWNFGIWPDGKLRFAWSTNGSSLTNEVFSTVACGVTDGSDIFFRVDATLNTNPWQVKFWKSTDRQVWTQIGSTVTGTGPALMFNSVTDMNVSGVEGNSVYCLAGTTYEVVVTNAAGQIATAPLWIGMQPTWTQWVEAYGALWAKRGTNNHLKIALDLWDNEATPGTPLIYRARAFRDDGDIGAGDWVVDIDAPRTLTANVWRLKDPLDPSVNHPVQVVELQRTREKPLIVSDGIDTKVAVVSTGGVRSARMQATFRTSSIDEYEALENLLVSGRTLLLQGVLAQQWYVQPGPIAYEIVRATPTIGEGFPIRHLHEIKVPLYEVEAPD